MMAENIKQKTEEVICYKDGKIMERFGEDHWYWYYQCECGNEHLVLKNEDERGYHRRVKDEQGLS